MNAQRLLASCRKIVCVGRNYAAHAKEMGEALPTEPLLFLKPPSALILEGSAIEIPAAVTELHHEVELGLVVARAGRNVPVAAAWDYIGGYVLALDLTARNLQQVAKKAGSPWSVSKGYDTFCPISKYLPKSQLPDPQNVRLWCKVEGAMRQDGNTRDMIFHIPQLVAHISTIFSLQPGDIILTGTPDGVGPLAAGQTTTAGLGDGLLTMSFQAQHRR